MFRIKICGLTHPDDARAVAAAGADAIGLNFYPSSPRFVTQEQARAITAVLPPGCLKVGLFVNATVSSVLQTSDALQLDLIQLHGDEPPDYLQRLGERPIMRAFRLAGGSLDPFLVYLARCRELGCPPRLALVDAFHSGKYGGTGATVDWSLLADWRQFLELPPLVLAGGLTPANVAQAIRTVHPCAVDTASGVESSPGRKDPERVASFIQAATQAFAEAMPPSNRP